MDGFRGAEVDPDAIGLAIESIGDVLSAFPELVSGQEKGSLVLQLADFVADPKAYAVSRGSRGHVIRLNRAAFRSLDALEADYAEGVASGKFVKGTTAKAVLYHELGHVYAAVNRISSLRISRSIIGSQDKVEVARYLRANLSQYSASYSNGQEIISEVFSAWFSNTGNQFANEFMARLLELRTL